MEIVLFWLVLAIIVGVAANTRGRSGFGWFLLAAIISPLIAGLLLLALPRISGVAPKSEDSDRLCRTQSRTHSQTHSLSSRMEFMPGFPTKCSRTLRSMR